jgi:flagellar motor protein MotB
VVEGKGSREPIASNNDDAGRARNRRVEIFVAEPQSRG